MVAPLLLRANPRQRFIGDVGDLVGRQNMRALWLPGDSEALVAQDAAVPSRLWTHANSPRGRLTRLGAGWALSFNGTSDYLTTPDAADLSFGNGTVDQALSALAVASVVDTASLRAIICKSATSHIEWNFLVNGTDKLSLFVMDNSVAQTPFRESDAAVSQGSWQTFGVSYSGVGGATAADGIATYQGGVAMASTATNSGTYVAMEDKDAAVLIGAQNAGAAQFFNGSLACVVLVQANLSATQQAEFARLSRQRFGLAA